MALFLCLYKNQYRQFVYIVSMDINGNILTSKPSSELLLQSLWLTGASPLDLQWGLSVFITPFFC